MSFAILHSFGFWIFISSILYGLLLYRFPNAWLTVILATLPVLDFAPWTGEFFFDEFDGLLCLTLLAVLCRRGLSDFGRLQIGWTSTSMVLMACLFLSAFVAAFNGAYPFPAIDINSFNNYLSSYNALRVFKGVAFAYALLLLLVVDMVNDKKATLRRVTLGFTLGTLGASLGVIWERLSFTGLLNFDSGYRVVGLFSGMHTGGAYIEAYLVTALPFVIWWEMQNRQWQVRVAAILIFLMGCYALLVTYARGGYVAFVLSCLVLFLGVALRQKSKFIAANLTRTLLIVLLIGGGLFFAYQATPMHARFNQVAYDKSQRLHHWGEIVGMMDKDLKVTMFGEGLGRLPEIFFRHTKGQKQSEFRFVSDTDRTYLQLVGGEPIYYEQVVNLQAQHRYQMQVQVRNKTKSSEMYLSLCRKWMLYSLQCEWYRVKLDPSLTWQTHVFNVNVDRLKRLPWYALSSVKLSLENDVSDTTVEIASVSVQSEDGSEMVRNGDFSQGSRYWFFSTDNHLPWHFKNFLLQLFFEQGVIGLMLMLSALIYSANILAKRHQDPDYPAALYAAVLTGFLGVGVIDSLFDFPRMSLIFYLLLMLIQFQNPGYKRVKNHL
ncbi:hypothetical protein [Undibacterium sp. SXout20W]|uniref:hypothetical protein n=1 Tax=Undibacterium sp. SXout20W TaxID=3413051 RepID=UPI003BF28F2C